jgi:FixJ family two-component response regulator
MHPSAVLLCHDKKSLETLTATLEELGIEAVKCHSPQETLERVIDGECDGHCSTLIVDFALPGAEEVIRMAALLPTAQKPTLLAIASGAWPGTGQAFQSGVSRILYRPLAAEQLKDALKVGRKAARQNRRQSSRYEVKTLVHLDLKSGTLTAVSIDIGENGLSIQAAEPVPVNRNLAFRCVLPGTHFTLQGHADVIWASDQGRAGLFFSNLSPAARKHFKQWLNKRSSNSKAKHKPSVHQLMPPLDASVSFSVAE